MEKSFYLGTWINTYQESIVISRLDIFEQAGTLYMHCYGPEGGVGAEDWGVAPVASFSPSPDQGDRVNAFEVEFELGHLSSHLCINENKGLLVVAAFHRFHDGSGRSNFFSRQFYFKK
jgi:hypothetical protein